MVNVLLAHSHIYYCVACCKKGTLLADALFSYCAALQIISVCMHGNLTAAGARRLKKYAVPTT